MNTAVAARPTTVADSSPLPAAGTEDAAVAESARTGRNVEVAALRSESSEVYATPRGNFQAVEHLRPVRTRVGGEWKTIDTGLERRRDGSVGPKVAAVGIGFSGGGDQPLITLDRAGRKLSLSWPTALPAPSIAGDTATYSEVLPGVDLQVRADIDGASEVLVVKTAKAATDPRLAKLQLAVDSGGMTLSQRPDGGLQAVDVGAGGVVFEAPQPMMWDSSTKAGTSASAPTRTDAATGAAQAGAVHVGAWSGPGDSAKVAPIGVAVASGGSELVLTPDQGLLKSAQYPVYIDPQWYSPKASSWTMVSRYWASSPQWKFNGNPDAGVGYCSGDSRCAPEDLKRLFYQVPTSAFAGKTILSAEFVVQETHSYSCSARNVELWRTKGISSSTTWNSQLASGFWIDKLATVNTAHGYGTGCAAGDVEFWALRAVQQAAANGWATTTFGIKATDEGDPYSWKRFSDDAYLRVEYNRPPAQISMSQLTSNPGGACGKPGAAKYVRILPTLTANNVTDPDGDDVAVQFAANWDSGDGKGTVMRWASALSTYKKSGSDFAITLPSSAPKSKTISWYARSYDKAQYSPWSWAGSATTCSIVYDTSVPAGPSISSGQYPPSDPENPDDPWTDGVGRYGSFTIDSTSTDVVKYWFGINADPSSAHTVTTSGGGAVTMKFMPAKPGVNYVTAQAFDTAGNGSQISRYQFRVRAGQPERLSLGVDEPAGASSISGTGGAWVADLHGGVQSGGQGVTGTGLHLNGVDGYASTASPVLNTGKSFSVSVWAKLPAAQPSLPLMALSQNGQYTSGFQLYYSPTSGGWVFARFTSDIPSSPGFVRAAQPSCATGDTACTSSRLGTWTHVAGVFDNPDSLLKLYVNGTLVATAPFSGPWDARGQTMIGANTQNGTLKSFFSGDLDEAQLFDNQLPDDQIARLAGKQPVVDPERPAKVVWSFDEDAAATSVTGHAQQVNALLRGSPQLGGAGVDRTSLHLDGVDDDAVTTQPVLDTYQSFAVSLWARLAVESRTSVAVHQAGVNNRGFEIYHSSAGAGWVFQRATSDTVGAPLVRAVQNACPAGSSTCAADRLGEWTHVIAVYDIDAAQMRLYVDGVLVDTEAFTTPWLAKGPITLGASNYPSGFTNFLKGDLDDVRFYDRALSVNEITGLFAQHPVVKARWQLESSSGSPATSPDASAGNRPVTLYNGAHIDTGFVDNNALNLDGVDDYAATGSVPIDTSRSFTVTAWALSSTARPTKNGAVISQEGSVNSAFTVRYVADPAGTGRWRIVMPNADTTSAATASADNTSFDDYGSGGWNHLALVYDSFAGQMRLYVNGQLEQTVCADSDGDGTPDDPTCTNIVSWASNAIGFNATKSLQFGRAKTGGVWGENWSGSIDDVWAFQGVLSQTQIQQLATGTPGLPTAVPGDG